MSYLKNINTTSVFLFEIVFKNNDLGFPWIYIFCIYKLEASKLFFVYIGDTLLKHIYFTHGLIWERQQCVYGKGVGKLFVLCELKCTVTSNTMYTLQYFFRLTKVHFMNLHTC